MAKRPRQIANILGISEQNLHYRLQRLEKANIIIQGPRWSYREWSINKELEKELKEKISEFKARKRIALVEFNMHRLSVSWPIKKCEGARLKHKRCRWRSELTEELVEYNSLFFRAELTPKNFIIRFPADFGINYVGFRSGEAATKSVISNCLLIGEEVKKKVVKRFGEKLVLGPGKPKGEHATKSILAEKLTKLGITFTMKKGDSWVRIDKSLHFSPRGEIETNKVMLAQAIVEMPFYIDKLRQMFGNDVNSEAIKWENGRGLKKKGII